MSMKRLVHNKYRLTLKICVSPQYYYNKYTRLAPMRHLLLLFIVMPIVEMWVLITVGSSIGAFSTIGLVLLTALIGIVLLKEQGFDTLWRGREKLYRGQVPAQEMIEGIILAVSGALLLTPGFVTDTIGFMGLMPSFRRLFIKGLLHKIKVTHLHHSSSKSQYKSMADDEIIDGQSWEIDGHTKNIRDK